MIKTAPILDLSGFLPSNLLLFYLAFNYISMVSLVDRIKLTGNNFKPYIFFYRDQ